MKSKKRTKFNNLPDLNNCTIAVIGLGYVGLPLAIEFGKQKHCCISGEKLDRKIIGFDINKKRLEELNQGNDNSNEISHEELTKVKFYYLTSEVISVSKADVFIVSVPTPINS